MDALLKIEAVASQHSLKSVRHLYDEVESHVRSLKSLGGSSDSYGSLLVPVVANKLPQELQETWRRRLGFRHLNEAYGGGGSSM